MSEAPTDQVAPYVALVVDPDIGWRKRSIQAAGAHAMPIEAPNMAAARTMLDTTPVNIVIFGPGTGVSVSGHITPLLRERPGLGVVLIIDDPGIDAMRAALHAGVREVLPGTAGIQELSDAVGRLADVVAPLTDRSVDDLAGAAGATPGAVGRLVMICSAKGGTGVSTLSMNLAAALARLGHSVTLCDADPMFGDLPLLMGLKTRPELEPGQLPKGLQPDEVHSELVLHEPTGVRLFPMYRTHMPLGDLPDELTMAVFTGLQAVSDVVIVDMPAPLVNVAQFLVHADEVFFVAGTDVASLKNLRLARQLMANADLPVERAWMILNRIRNYADFEPAGYTQIVGLPVVCAVPDSGAFVTAGDSAEVLVHTAPRDHASRAITRFAQQLSARFDQPADSATA